MPARRRKEEEAKCFYVLVATVFLFARPAQGIIPQPTYFNSTYGSKISLATAANVTKGSTIRCACEAILRGEGVRTSPVDDGTGNLVWYDGPDSLGDGFGFIYSNATSIIQQILAAPLNDSAIYVPTNYLSGVNVWALNKIAELGQFKIEYYVTRLNPAAWASGDKIRQAQIMYSQGFDCLWSATIVQPDRLPYMRFMQVSQTYGYTVVGLGPVVPETKLRDRLFVWTKPFTNGVWGLIFASLAFAAVMMVIFEGGAANSEFSREHSIGMKLYVSFHNALRGYCQTGYFEPVTRAGISYSMGYGFFLFLIASTYTANLASFFVNAGQPVLAIASVSDFAAKNIPVCIVNKVAHKSWVSSMYPDLATRGLIKIINGTTGTSLVKELVNGDCVGGISTDVHIRFALGPLDPQCAFSNAMPIGNNLNTGYYAIPFNPSSTIAPDVFVNALGTLFTFPLQANSYQTYADTVFPPNSALCAFTSATGGAAALNSGSQAGGSASLTVQDLCGVFLLQAIGLVLAGITFAWDYIHGSIRAGIAKRTVAVGPAAFLQKQGGDPYAPAQPPAAAQDTPQQPQQQQQQQWEGAFGNTAGQQGGGDPPSAAGGGGYGSPDDSAAYYAGAYAQKDGYPGYTGYPQGQAAAAAQNPDATGSWPGSGGLQAGPTVGAGDIGGKYAYPPNGYLPAGTEQWPSSPEGLKRLRLAQWKAANPEYAALMMS